MANPPQQKFKNKLTELKSYVPDRRHSIKNLNGLYAITPEQSDTATLLYQVEQALLGGINLLQYRAKKLSPQLRKQQANELRSLCADFKCPLIINDDVQLTAEVGAHGVHLGQSDESPEFARTLLGTDALIGITCHASLQYAEVATNTKDTVNYLAFGAFFPSPSKPNAQLATISILSKARERFSLPIVAIGGITPNNAAPLIEAGADMIAVIDSLFTSKDIQAKCRQFHAVFESASSH